MLHLRMFVMQRVYQVDGNELVESNVESVSLIDFVYGYGGGITCALRQCYLLGLGNLLCYSLIEKHIVHSWYI